MGGTHPRGDGRRRRAGRRSRQGPLERPRLQQAGLLKLREQACSESTLALALFCQGGGVLPRTSVSGAGNVRPDAQTRPCASLTRDRHIYVQPTVVQPIHQQAHIHNAARSHHIAGQSRVRHITAVHKPQPSHIRRHRPPPHPARPHTSPSPNHKSRTTTTTTTTITPTPTTPTTTQVSTRAAHPGIHPKPPHSSSPNHPASAAHYIPHASPPTHPATQAHHKQHTGTQSTVS